MKTNIHQDLLSLLFNQTSTLFWEFFATLRSLFVVIRNCGERYLSQVAKYSGWTETKPAQRCHHYRWYRAPLCPPRYILPVTIFVLYWTTKNLKNLMRGAKFNGLVQQHLPLSLPSGGEKNINWPSFRPMRILTLFSFFFLEGVRCIY